MYFLAFEGLDGSGKSTLIKTLKAELDRRGQAALVTREPGGSALGDEIRTLLVRREGEAPVPRAEALLYQAARAQHVELRIRPALEQKQWVISDRFAASSLAFQSDGRALGRDQVEWLNEFSTGGLKPHLYVLLDLSVEASAARLSTRGEPVDRLEAEDRSFHERVRNAYLDLAKKEPARWLVLDASQPALRLGEQLLVHLKEARWLL